MLSEGFFWIPSLAGPTHGQSGVAWLKLVDGTPPLGWHDTAAYLVLPVLLVVSQFISQRVATPPAQGPEGAGGGRQPYTATSAILPLMIGQHPGLACCVGVPALPVVVAS